jgi:hypothetical protein
MESELVKMTPEERAEFEAFKKEKERKDAERKQREEREIYKQIVDDCIDQATPELSKLSQLLSQKKTAILETFRKAIEMKQELFEVKTDQRSHTFTNSAGDVRITIGQHVTDDYRDTVNEGIAKVEAYIKSLAKDENSGALVDAVMRLLSKDQKGNIKASRVLQLQRMANQSGDKTFIEGVQIIQEAYQPALSSWYVRCDIKKDGGAWESIPLGMTEVQIQK